MYLMLRELFLFIQGVDMMLVAILLFVLIVSIKYIVCGARRLCGREQEGGSNLNASTDTRQEEAFRDINLIFRSISSVLRIRTLILIRKRIEVLEPNRNLQFSYLLVFQICLLFGENSDKKMQTRNYIFRIRIWIRIRKLKFINWKS